MKYFRNLILMVACLFSYSSQADWYSIKDSAGKLMVIGTANDKAGRTTAVYIQCRNDGPLIIFESRKVDQDVEDYKNSLTKIWFTYLQKREEFTVFSEPILLPNGVVAFHSPLKAKNAKALIFALSRNVEIEFETHSDGIENNPGTMILHADGGSLVAAAMIEGCKIPNN